MNQYLFAQPVNFPEYYFNIAVLWVLLVVKIFAFTSALLYSTESFNAAGKLTKPTWCAILGFAVALQVLPIPLSIINLAMTIAALVYLADVRPALAGLRRR